MENENEQVIVEEVSQKTPTFGTSTTLDDYLLKMSENNPRNRNMSGGSTQNILS